VNYMGHPLLQGNLAGCVSKQLGEEAGTVLARETLKADPEALAKLMADHTRVRGHCQQRRTGTPKSFTLTLQWCQLTEASKVRASCVCQQPATVAAGYGRSPVVHQQSSAVPPVLHRWANVTVLPPAAAGLAAAAAAHTRAVPQPHRRAVRRLPGGRLPRGRRPHPRLSHGQFGTGASDAPSRRTCWMHVLHSGRLRLLPRVCLGQYVAPALAVASCPDVRYCSARRRWCLKAATTGCTWRSRPPSIALCATLLFMGCRRCRRPSGSDSTQTLSAACCSSRLAASATGQSADVQSCGDMCMHQSAV
jgi:hypothetical protein